MAVWTARSSNPGVARSYPKDGHDEILQAATRILLWRRSACQDNARLPGRSSGADCPARRAVRFASGSEPVHGQHPGIGADVAGLAEAILHEWPDGLEEGGHLELDGGEHLMQLGVGPSEHLDDLAGVHHQHHMDKGADVGELDAMGHVEDPRIALARPQRERRDEPFLLAEAVQAHFGIVVEVLHPGAALDAHDLGVERDDLVNRHLIVLDELAAVATCDRHLLDLALEQGERDPGRIAEQFQQRAGVVGRVGDEAGRALLLQRTDCREVQGPRNRAVPKVLVDDQHVEVGDIAEAVGVEEPGEFAVLSGRHAQVWLGVRQLEV